MNNNAAVSITLVLLAIFTCSCNDSGTQKAEPGLYHDLSGPFLGQPLPDSIPELFAPGIIGTGMFTRDVAISPDGKEFYYCVALGNYTYATILYTREVNGQWQPPKIVPFSGGPGVIDFEPAFSPDGSRLFFLSTRPDGDEPPGDQDIWYVEREGSGWGQPVNLGEPVNTDGGEFFPSLTSDGTLYFTRNQRGSALNQVYRSRFVEGAYQEPELLPAQVNCGSNRFNAFVSSSEDYMIIPAQGMEDSFDGVDYYIVFRDGDDRWSDPVNMGPRVNQDNPRGWSPYVTPDGSIFFFMATRTLEIEREAWNYANLQKLHQSSGNGNADIYWMDARFIEHLRKQAEFHP
jgi:hypothetical protein